jgi:hypothetical protein
VAHVESVRKVDAAVATLWMVMLGTGENGVAEKPVMEGGVFVIVVTGLDEQRQAEADKTDETQHNRGVVLHLAGLDESKYSA